MNKNINKTSSKSDSNTCVSDLKRLVGDFIQERQWEKFHTPRNIAASVAIEAAELLEHFQWSGDEDISDKKKHDIGEELADVMAYLLSLANRLDIDVATAMNEKMIKNRLKYPVDDIQGNLKKLNKND